MNPWMPWKAMVPSAASLISGYLIPSPPELLLPFYSEKGFKKIEN